MADLTVSAFFTQNTGQPAVGLALGDIDFYLTRVNIETLVDNVLWGGAQNPTEEVDNIGAYVRMYEDADLETYIYFWRATYTGAVVLDQDDVTGSIPCINPWAFNTRTLSTAAAATLAAVQGSVITQYRATTWSITITGLGSLAGRTALYFSIKHKTSQPDIDAIVRIEETAGLERINGTAATVAGNGTLVVDDAVAGDITITLAAAETEKLQEIGGLYYDVKMVTATVQLLTINRFNIEAVATGAIV